VPRGHREVVTEVTPRGRVIRPQYAPHFSELVRRTFPKETDLETTIDWRIQCHAEKALRQHLSPLIREGITNGAVVVIDNRTRAVRALVGSRDFSDERYGGQINGALAPRSPGSALKPFVYGLALDLGLISPKQMLSDVPVDYSGYSPSNYDGKYHGGISAAEALQCSLNVPAVNLGARLKGRFYSFLKQGGLTTLDYPEEHYGLPIVLGSCEVRLLELANLYSTLASGGKYQPVRLLEKERTLPPVQLLSEGSAYILGEILSELRRPDLPNCWEFTVGLPRVAWKTGTSYGRRDAWSIGYNPEFTVGVWMGNFSGREADRLVGAEVAAPLLFDIFNALTASRAWFERPSSVGVRKVCPLSGMPAGEDCPEPVEELFLYGISPVKRCDMHQKLMLDEKTGLRLTRRCLEGRSHVEKVAVLWPRDIAMWMKKEGYPVEDIPGYAPDCGDQTPGPGPVILSPADRSDYYLRADAPLEYQKMLLNASVSNEVSKIFWFIDGQLLVIGPPQERVFYYPTPGKHRIVCMDDRGASVGVSVQVHNES
jgi:penicillin-binding protein 1C